MTFLRSSALVFAALMIGGCQTQSPVKPADISLGEDVCGTCDDVIKDRRFAAEYIMAGSVVKKFDDPGCLFRALRNEPDPPSAAFFQHIDNEQWISDKDVWLATTPQTTSPHGYNWAAYGSFAEAQNAVSRAGGGQVLPFAAAKERIARIISTPVPTAPPTGQPEDS